MSISRQTPRAVLSKEWPDDGEHGSFGSNCRSLRRDIVFRSLLALHYKTRELKRSALRPCLQLFLLWALIHQRVPGSSPGANPQLIAREQKGRLCGEFSRVVVSDFRSLRGDIDFRSPF